MGYHWGPARRGNNYNRWDDNNRRNVNLDDRPSNGFGMTLGLHLGDFARLVRCMKRYGNIYPRICSYENLELAFRKAKKGKTTKDYVVEFEIDLEENLKKLKEELENFTYSPAPMDTFVVRDPKTRVISASHFRDRVVHHALINVIGPIFEKSFIHDSFANQKGKGTHSAIMRFEKFMRKVCGNGKQGAGCWKLRTGNRKPVLPCPPGPIEETWGERSPPNLFPVSGFPYLCGDNSTSLPDFRCCENGRPFPAGKVALRRLAESSEILPWQKSASLR